MVGEAKALGSTLPVEPFGIPRASHTLTLFQGLRKRGVSALNLSPPWVSLARRHEGSRLREWTLTMSVWGSDSPMHCVPYYISAQAAG